MGFTRGVGRFVVWWLWCVGGCGFGNEASVLQTWFGTLFRSHSGCCLSAVIPNHRWLSREQRCNSATRGKVYHSFAYIPPLHGNLKYVARRSIMYYCPWHDVNWTWRWWWIQSSITVYLYLPFLCVFTLLVLFKLKHCRFPARVSLRTLIAYETTCLINIDQTLHCLQ